jgi:fatty-acyl-CoA synthase
VGEVWCAGPTVFPGYLGQPEADAEAFAPAAAAEGAPAGAAARRWFRTGDLALALEGGYLAVVDRRKDMARRGGARSPCSPARSLARSLAQ